MMGRSRQNLGRVLGRRAVLGGMVSAVAGTALANAPVRSLRPVARSGPIDPATHIAPEVMLLDAALSGTVAFMLADAETGEVLEANAEQIAQPPASVAKAVTALYALDQLGAEHRFETQVIATGGFADGVCLGDLVLVGSGDPTLDTDAMESVARDLKAVGLREVRGEFQIYEDALPYVATIDAQQPDYLGYSPSVSGLNLNFNRVHFEWRRAGADYSVTMDARSEKHRPDVAMARMRVERRETPVYAYSDGGHFDQWSVARGALGNAGARWLPVRKPGLYAADVLRTFARAQGIALGTASVTRARPEGAVLARFLSGTMTEQMRGMLKFSTNLTAEAAGLAASQRTGAIDGLSASASLMNRWCKAELGIDATFVDHSGLGDQSRISAEQMVAALVRVGPNGNLRPILKDIDMTDEDRKRIGDHPVQIAAKTGTLNFVSALAGYIRAVDGRMLAFAFFAADVERRAAISRSDREDPSGARSYNRRAKRLQQRLLQRWGALYTVDV
ncbi:MAG: D-alanyl-D-alanine carboxypeptidase/D-alanyl-D-alanine-endopeptidase [Paracoccaceae bacterium]|nr:D-alanyl-D-alanine carboxypeptidase/D-alanyl-D-alanine-endopeptidase [Paracoccaceae bacterium]